MHGKIEIEKHREKEIWETHGVNGSKATKNDL